jgi:hypothetical protein
MERPAKPLGAPKIPVTVLVLVAVAVWLSALASPRPKPLHRQAPTLRDRWELVRLGMTVEQVWTRLGPPGGPDSPWVLGPTHAEVWAVEDGRVVRESYDPPWKVYFLDRGPTRTDPATARRYERWGGEAAVVCVAYDPDGRVDETVWLEERRSPTH